MTNQLTLQKGTTINAGNHLISVGTFNTSDIAILSKRTGDFVQFKDIPKKNSPLNKIKLRFKHHLCCDHSLVFSWMSKDNVLDIIKILKTNK